MHLPYILIFIQLVYLNLFLRRITFIPYLKFHRINLSRSSSDTIHKNMFSLIIASLLR